MSQTPAAASPALDRAAIVREARSWIGTPYRLGGRVKGGGCDCATFIAEVLIACGLAERENLGVYSQDWFFHTSNERYLRGLLSLSAETAETVAHRSANVLFNVSPEFG